MPDTPRELKYGALFAYSPRKESESARQSQRLCHELKRDGFTRPQASASPSKPQVVSNWVADWIRNQRSKLPFSAFFGVDVTLVPMPTHARRDERALWVPMRLCEALCRAGMGGSVLPCVVRTSVVPKAALARPLDRPTVEQHVASMSIERPLDTPREILLVDDVVTRGATFMAASIRILEAFPNARVHAFAVMRTISDLGEFRETNDPCVGRIELYDSGKTHREP